MRDHLEPEVEPEVEQNLPVDIRDSFDPSLRFDELQVEFKNAFF